MIKLGQLNRQVMPVFVTLTYPSEFPSDSETYKRHLRNFFERMRRRFPGASAFWKLEYQQRGAPHYHLLVFGVPYQYLLAWVSLAWYQTVGSGDIKHLHAGTQVQMIRSYRGIMAYAAKYLGKLDDNEAEHPGRFWGVFQADFLPWAELVTYSVGVRDVLNIMRIMRRFMGIKGHSRRTLQMLCDADQWERLINSS